MSNKKRLFTAAIIAAAVYALAYFSVFMAHTFLKSPYIILLFYIFVPFIITIFTFFYSLRLHKAITFDGAKKKLFILISFEIPAIALTAVFMIIDLIKTGEVIFSDYNFVIAIFICILAASLSGCNLNGLLGRRKK